MAVLSSQSQPQQQQQQPSSSSCTSSCSTGSKSQPKFHPVDDYKKALHTFVPPKDQSRDEPIVGTEGELRFTRSEDPLVDEYFLFVAHEGRPHLPWELIRPAFVWKLRVVMDDMHMMEAEQLKDEHQKELLVANVEIKETKQFIMEKAGEFEGTPFTIQRLCELLIQPTKHYHAAAVFLRALEKNINVVTTITEDGHRITGVDESMGMEEEAPIPVERNFIISVDEMDEPLSKKLARHQQQQQNGSGGGSGDIQQQSTGVADSSRDQKEGESAADGDVEMKQPAEVE